MNKPNLNTYFMMYGIEISDGGRSRPIKTGGFMGMVVDIDTHAKFDYIQNSTYLTDNKIKGVMLKMEDKLPIELIEYLEIKNPNITFMVE